MKYGKFVILDIEHSIIDQIQSDMIAIRDLRYFLTGEEISIIDDVNVHFSNNGMEEFRIDDYDVIGWALNVDRKLQFLEESTKQRSQAESLLWVARPGFNLDETGRISRTILEIAILVRAFDKSWTKKTRYSKSVKKREPFKAKSVTDNIQQLVLEHLREEDSAVDFYFPSGLLDEIINRDADVAEHIKRDTLIKLNILTDSGEPTQFATALIDIIERWWLVESLISHPNELETVVKKIPLETLLYAMGEANQSLSIEKISEINGTDFDATQDRILRILAHYREIMLRFSENEQEIVPYDQSAGIELCSMKMLVERIAHGPLWYWLVPETPDGYLVRKEITLLTLRDSLIQDIVSKLIHNEVKVVMITAPAGWGKTGALLQIAEKFGKREIPVALYRGGTPSTRIPRNSIVLVDDVHKLNQSSLRYLNEMQEEGFQIIMTLSQEYEFIFTERLARVECKTTKFHYDIVRIPRLTGSDVTKLLKDNFPNLSPEDYERLLQKIKSLNNAPEAIAFLSMQWEHLNRGPIHLLNPVLYSLFKTPRILFDVFRVDSTKHTTMDSELAALVILWELGGEIHSKHDIFITQLAKDITNSQNRPRYYKSFLEPVSLPDYPRLLLNFGVRKMLDLAKEPELYQSIIIGLYRENIISKFEWEWAITLMNAISKIRLQCEKITEAFFDKVLLHASEREKLELMHYVAFIGSPRVETGKIVESHYDFLRDISHIDLVKNNITPLFLSRTLANLATVVNHELFSDLEKIVLPLFDMFRNLWKRKSILPQDEFNASYLALLAAIARKRMQLGDFKEALDLYDEGIALASMVQHITSQDRLLCDRIQLLRHLSPVFCKEIYQSVQSAIEITKKIETLDSRPLEAIVRNQEAMAMLYCGEIQSAKTAAQKAENLLLEYEIDPPSIHHTTPLELAKSKAWSYIELGLCEFNEENYRDARIHFKFAKQSLVETRHNTVINQVIGFEPVVYLREGKLSEADTLVAQIIQLQLPIGAWSLSGSSVSYYYHLFENSTLERLEESEKLRLTTKNFYQIDDDMNLTLWFDLLRRIIYNRKKGEYSTAKELGFEFLENVLESDLSRQALVIDYLRTVLSFVLRELGIVYFKKSDYKNSSEILLASLVYWTPICGSRNHHAVSMLLECISKLNTDFVSFSYWRFQLDAETGEHKITLKDAEKAVSDFWGYHWVGIPDLIQN